MEIGLRRHPSRRLCIGITTPKCAHKARMLMVHEGLRAGIAAERVGYESPSQFSREFKRLFGASPLEETERVRRMLGVAEPASMVGSA